MNRAEFLDRVQWLEGEALFRQTMQLVARESIECYLEFTSGPLAHSQPKLRLWFQEDDDEDDETIEELTLLLSPRVVGILQAPQDS